MGIGARGARSRASPWSETTSRRRWSLGGGGTLYGVDLGVVAWQATRAGERGARVWEARLVCARHSPQEQGKEPGDWSGVEQQEGQMGIWNRRRQQRELVGTRRSGGGKECGLDLDGWCDLSVRKVSWGCGDSATLEASTSWVFKKTSSFPLSGKWQKSSVGECSKKNRK